MIVSWCYKQKESIVWLLVKSLSCVWLFVSPWTVAYQVPPSMGFSRQEYWNGLPLALRQCIYCCCCSFTKSCSTLCNPMDCSTPGSSVLHYLPEFAQILVHGVDDAIQPSHPLSFPSPPALNLSQHQGLFHMSQLFTSGGQSIGVSASASVLPMNTQDRSPLGWTGWISLLSKGLSRVFSNNTVQKHQFFGAQLSL